jgi:hypothetical protein
MSGARVLVTITTTNDDEGRHVLTLDTLLGEQRLDELHAVARSMGTATGILGPHTQAVSVEVSFPD